MMCCSLRMVIRSMHCYGSEADIARPTIVKQQLRYVAGTELQMFLEATLALASISASHQLLF